VEPVAKQIEDEYEDEEEVDISAVTIRISYSRHLKPLSVSYNMLSEKRH
jgi:hypothetical protein